jgi:dolichol-phosphate mannosyltransferase
VASTPPAAPLVSIVVPTRNEAGNVGPLWTRIAAALGQTPFEVCFVDDSDDETGDLLLRLESRDGRIRCQFRQGEERAGGLSTAVVAGLHMARGRYVCVMDADLQHPPETIPALLNGAEHGADLVVASRYSPGGSRSGLGGSGRRMVSRGATMVARLLFKEARRSADPLSGFFLCRRALIDGIEFRPVGFKILLELLVCVPGLRVVDVPVAQEKRAAGDSKATLRQGLLYLGHLRSLFLDVPGSARFWKFGLVGLSGLGVFLPVLWALTGLAHWNPVLAFLPAYALSAAWNSILNWRWMFADQRRTRAAQRRYHEWALLSGLVMLGAFVALLQAHPPVVVAGLGAALVAMAVNGLINRAQVNSQPSAWAQVAVDQGVQASLARLAGQVGADRAYVLPARGEGPAGLPPGILAHVITHRRPILLTEAASYRAQRRTNIEDASRLLVPVVQGDRVTAIVVCERYAPRGFDSTALETATLAVADLVPALSAVVPLASSRTDVPAPRPAAHTTG